MRVPPRRPRKPRYSLAARSRSLPEVLGRDDPGKAGRAASPRCGPAVDEEGLKVAVAATVMRDDRARALLSPDYHVDLAVACDDALGNPSLVVLVEVQLDVDADKQRSWPLYQGAARARFKCDACVLVVAIEPRVATWASAPVPLGPGGSVFQAVVLGPAQREERGRCVAPRSRDPVLEPLIRSPVHADVRNLSRTGPTAGNPATSRVPAAGTRAAPRPARDRHPAHAALPTSRRSLSPRGQ